MAGVDPAEFAEYLRAERERRRLTLEQVADETKIASHHLAALERGDVRNWPGGMYRRAMMRAYAESIGVDREFALKQFEQAFDAPPPHAEPVAPTASPSPAPWAAPAARVREWRVPQLRMPEIAIPRIAIPRVAIPRVAVPRVAMPQVSLPRWQPSRAIAARAAVAAVAMLALVGAWTIVSRFSDADADTSTTVAAPTAATATATAAAAPAPAPPSAAVPATTRAEAPVVGRTETAATTGAATTGAAATRPLASDATLMVASDPPGARVTVNGIGWGETPVTIRHLEFGAKRVRLTMAGYVSQEREVRVAPDRPSTTVRLTLRERQRAASER